MLKHSLVLAACLLLGACANADGSMPRLTPAGNGTIPSSFTGGYAGTNGGFGNLNTKSVPF